MTLSPYPQKADMPCIVDVEELGRRIRHMRIERRLTLKQIEARSGLSATHISEIERGRTSPTVGALVRIARALSKDASYFIETEERGDIHHGERGPGARPARGLEPISRGIPGSMLFSYRITLAAGEFEIQPQAGEGDAIYYVVRGAAKASVGGHAVNLAAGDSVHASLQHAHQFHAAGDGPCEIVMVSSIAVSA